MQRSVIPCAFLLYLHNQLSEPEHYFVNSRSDAVLSEAKGFCYRELEPVNSSKNVIFKLVDFGRASRAGEDRDGCRTAKVTSVTLHSSDKNTPHTMNDFWAISPLYTLSPSYESSNRICIWLLISVMVTLKVNIIIKSISCSCPCIPRSSYIMIIVV